MRFDDVLREIGEIGPYQLRVYLTATAPAILLAFETLSVIFTFNIPPHRCAIPGYPGDTYTIQNETHAMWVNFTIPQTNGQWDRCHVFKNVTYGVIPEHMSSLNSSQSACDHWVYDQSVFKTTVATDFDVVCASNIARANSNMISEASALIGVFICGFLSDRFGRKVSYYLGGVTLVAGGFGIAFTQHIVAFNILRVFLGFARMSIVINCVILGLELVGPSKRTFAAMFMEYVWVAGEYLLILFAYFIREWRWLEIAVSIPSIIMLFYYWLLPESPRWLASRGRMDEAMKVLEKIAASNKKQLPNIADGKQLLERDATVSLRHVFQSSELVKRTLILFGNIFVNAVVYYGLTLNITNLSGDIYVNLTINVTLELVGYLAPYYLLDKLGRKPVYCTSIIMGGVFCTCSFLPVILGSPNWVVLLLSYCGRFCISCAFAVIYLYGPELIPTSVRASVMSAAVTFSRIGSLLSPYLADAGILAGGKYRDVLALIVMGLPAVIVGLLALWLPETAGRKLPETIEDLNDAKGRCCWKPRRSGKVEPGYGTAANTHRRFDTEPL